MVETCNRMLADLGLNPFGEPIYMWKWAPSIVFLRFRDREWRMRDGLWIPDNQYEQYRPFVHLGERWVLTIWQWMDEQRFRAEFGAAAYWPPQGFYFPTDKVLKPGIVPTKDITEYLMACIRYSRGRSKADLDQEAEDILNAEEKASFSRIVDMVTDSLTAFGNKPGTRSGGVSFPYVERQKSHCIDLPAAPTG